VRLLVQLCLDDAAAVEKLATRVSGILHLSVAVYFTTTFGLFVASGFTFYRLVELPITAWAKGRMQKKHCNPAA
jgi:hypothetical protein